MKFNRLSSNSYLRTSMSSKSCRTAVRSVQSALSVRSYPPHAVISSDSPGHHAAHCTLFRPLSRSYNSTARTNSGDAANESAAPVKVHDSLHAINMPLIMGVKVGTVKKWNKRIGEAIKAGEMLCEVALNDFSVAIDASHGGVLAQIIVPAGSSIAAEQPIAAYARTMEEYFTYLDETRSAASDASMGAAVEELMAEHSQHPTAAVLMRTIRQLIKSGHINPSTENTKVLLSLARKGDAELLAVFESSYEGASFDGDSFDLDFFLANADEIIEERRSAAAAAASTADAGV